MSYIILLALMIWAISSIVKSASAKKAERNRQRQIARLNAEAKQRQIEAARIREEWKQRQAEAKAEVQRMVALEEAQMRMKIAEAEAWRKQEAWNAKQEEINRKHDEQIAKLQFRMSEAERTIAHYTPAYEALKAQYEELTLKIKLYEQRGLLTGNAKQELVKVSDKLYAIETKINKAKFDKEQAERKLA